MLWVFKNLRTCRVWMVLIKSWRCCEWWLSSFKGLLFSKKRDRVLQRVFLKRQEAHPKQQQMFGPRNRIGRSPLNKQIGYPLWDVTEPACSVLPARLLLYFFFYILNLLLLSPLLRAWFFLSLMCLCIKKSSSGPTLHCVTNWTSIVFLCW